MLGGNRIIIAHHFLSSLGRFQDVHHSLNCFFREKTIHDGQIKSQGLDIPDKGGIAINQNRFLEVNCFYKSVPEPFIKAGKGNEIRVRINIPQRIGVAVFAVSGPRIADANRNQAHHVRRRILSAIPHIRVLHPRLRGI